MKLRSNSFDSVRFPVALSIALAFICLAAESACRSVKSDANVRVPSAKRVITPLVDAGFEVMVPKDEGPYSPSQARTEGPIDVATVANTALCEGCHADAAKQWSVSAHARSSFDNPWYRSVVDRVRDEVSVKSSRHCAGCHDPLLLFSGKMDAPIQPEEPLANGGVTCLVCHSITETRSDGNASYTLSSAPAPMPNMDDPASIAAHKKRMAPTTLRTPALCNSCHRGFLGTHTGIPHHLSGIEEPGPWRSSIWAGSQAQLLDEELPARNCASCHMADEAAPLGDRAARDGRIRSHRFAGGHTPIAANSHDEAQLAALREQLEHAVTIDIARVERSGRVFLPAETARLRGGDRFRFDVVVRNTGVGHRFPGGVRDMKDTWLEVVIKDASGRPVLSAGDTHEQAEDPSAYVFRVLQIGEDGRPETQHLVHHFRAPAYDHSIGPREARVVRYDARIPAGTMLPISIEARIRHRRHREEARTLACEATRSERGDRFRATGNRLALHFLDGCATEPVIDMVSTTLLIAGDPSAARPTWQRLYEHALGLSFEIQEHLDSAKQSGERAMALASNATPRERAMIHWLLGRIAARQGRVADATKHADDAQALIGPHPALDRMRADAFMQVWRWPEAVAALERVTTAANGDTTAWRDLARAAMSVNDPNKALRAVQQGLRLQPRDEGLLRAETLALEALRHPGRTAAREAFLAFRDADAASEWRMRCDAVTPNCARDRLPVVTIEMRQTR